MRSTSSDERACCAECHFKWEERVLFPHLPEAVAARVRHEHERIEAAGMPAADVRRHAAWEEKVLREHLPPRIYAEMRRQHNAVDRPISLGSTDSRLPALGFLALAAVWLVLRKAGE